MALPSTIVVVFCGVFFWRVVEISALCFHPNRISNGGFDCHLTVIVVEWARPICQMDCVCTQMIQVTTRIIGAHVQISLGCLLCVHNSVLAVSASLAPSFCSGLLQPLFDRIHGQWRIDGAVQ